MNRKSMGSSRRSGMTLIEVIVALVILTISVLSMSTFVQRFIRSVTESNVRTTAGELVADRLEVIKGAGNYATLEASYIATENPVTGFPGYSRQTMIQRFGSTTAAFDYKVVTVLVTAPRLATPLKKTTVIAAY